MRIIMQNHSSQKCYATAKIITSHIMIKITKISGRSCDMHSTESSAQGAAADETLHSCTGVDLYWGGEAPEGTEDPH